MKVTKSDALMYRQPTLWGYLPKDTAEQEEYSEACMSPRMTETDTADTKKQEAGLLEEVLCPDNLYRAYKQAVGNKGAGGIDRMTVGELEPWLRVFSANLKYRELQSGNGGSCKQEFPVLQTKKAIAAALRKPPCRQIRGEKSEGCLQWRR